MTKSPSPGPCVGRRLGGEQILDVRLDPTLSHLRAGARQSEGEYIWKPFKPDKGPHHLDDPSRICRSCSSIEQGGGLPRPPKGWERARLKILPSSQPSPDARSGEGDLVIISLPRPPLHLRRPPWPRRHSMPKPLNRQMTSAKNPDLRLAPPGSAWTSQIPRPLRLPGRAFNAALARVSRYRLPPRAYKALLPNLLPNNLIRCAA